MTKRTVLNLFLLPLSFLLIWCWSVSTSTDSVSKESTVKIWVIAPLSWPAASYWHDAVNGYRYQLSLQSQEVQDRIELIIEDGKCNWKDASWAAVKLITVDKVDAILWWQCSWETMAAWKIAQQFETIILSPYSQKPEIHEIGEYVYRFWNGWILTDAMIEHIQETWKKRIWIISESTDFALSLANKFENEFTWEVLFFQHFDSNEKDYSLIIKRLIDQLDDIDWLVLLWQSDTTVAWILNAMKKEGIYNDLKENIYWANVFPSEPFLELIGRESANGLKEAAPYAKLDAHISEFKKWFEKDYEVQFEATFPTLSAEWMQLYIDAIKAWNTTSDSIKQFIDWFNESNPRTWTFGEYYFTQEGEAIGLKGDMYEIQDWVKVLID